MQHNEKNLFRFLVFKTLYTYVCLKFVKLTEAETESSTTSNEMLNTHDDDTKGLKLRSRPEFSCAGKKLSTYWDHRSHYNRPNDNDSNICQLLLFKSWARKITDIARYSLNFSILLNPVFTHAQATLSLHLLLSYSECTPRPGFPDYWWAGA